VKFKKFFILSICLLVVITVLDFFAFKNFWYWRWPWFDQPMHFLGGLLTGLVAIQIYLHLRGRDGWQRAGGEIALISIVVAILVGGLWEWLEFTADKLSIMRVEFKTLGMAYQGWRGSLHDLLFDLIGAVTATILFFITFIWSRTKFNHK